MFNDPPVFDWIATDACPLSASRNAAEYFRRGHDQALCNALREATRQHMRNFFASIVSFALPPRCAGCGRIVEADLLFCVECWQSLDLLSGQGCERCGTPTSTGAAICGPCLHRPPDHDGAIAVTVYGELARTISLKLKQGRKIGLAKLIASLMHRRLPGEQGLLIPVPAHRWRLFRRGFNQSALIARHLSRLSGLPVQLDVLRRARATPMLKGANAQDRARIVRGAFVVDRSLASDIAGRTVFLVDDVYTSGATANACARALKGSGAGKVIVLCWARVILGEHAD